MCFHFSPNAYFHSKAKNDSSESDALRHDLELERGERQRLKEDRDDLKERLRNTEMALEMMEAKEKDTLRQVCWSQRVSCIEPF